MVTFFIVLTCLMLLAGGALFAHGFDRLQDLEVDQEDLNQQLKDLEVMVNLDAESANVRLGRLEAATMTFAKSRGKRGAPKNNGNGLREKQSTDELEGAE